MTYTREDLIRSYLDAERYKSAEGVLAEDTQGFTASLQRAFQVSLNSLENKNFSDPLWPLALVFQQGVGAIQAQESGILEGGLLLSKLETLGTGGQRVLEQYISLGQARYEVTQQALSLLTAVVEAVWPDAPKTVTSEDLLRLGFDDSQRPDPVDYW
ncbi:hypothetical protein [Deinococcus aestuarii]|uniref:hypothetical protein n=1 Tax=Deinococcus aestuarii TaxID=2774531 RepID=UPI001C0C89FF|nr:hypothetical protein [Deinococcus aestuarii]